MSSVILILILIDENDELYPWRFQDAQELMIMVFEEPEVLPYLFILFGNIFTSCIDRKMN